MHHLFIDRITQVMGRDCDDYLLYEGSEGGGGGDEGDCSHDYTVNNE